MCAKPLMPPPPKAKVILFILLFTSQVTKSCNIANATEIILWLIISAIKFISFKYKKMKTKTNFV